MNKIVTTKWEPKVKLVVARLSGTLNRIDILQWKESLTNTMNELPANSSFRMLVDLSGFKAENFEVHKEFRTIIPLLLADYGYRIGYLEMFPEAQVELKNSRGIQCVAMANVHQDETKMKDYNDRFSNEHERYFTNSAAALQWISSV